MAREVFLMFGNHHAREWPSAEMPMEFAIDLVKGFQAEDPRMTDLLTRCRAILSACGRGGSPLRRLSR
jgi:hypothetical protein